MCIIFAGASQQYARAVSPKNTGSPVASRRYIYEWPIALCCYFKPASVGLGFMAYMNNEEADSERLGIRYNSGQVHIEDYQNSNMLNAVLAGTFDAGTWYKVFALWQSPTYRAIWCGTSSSSYQFGENTGAQGDWPTIQSFSVGAHFYGSTAGAPDHAYDGRMANAAMLRGDNGATEALAFLNGDDPRSLKGCSEMWTLATNYTNAVGRMALVAGATTHAPTFDGADQPALNAWPPAASGGAGPGSTQLGRGRSVCL
jgi:hypothetical protein